MTVVNKFNVNKQQVTLDADIIENMSANDVSYNAYTQYDENTVGDKLSELSQKIDGEDAINISLTNSSDEYKIVLFASPLPLGSVITGISRRKYNTNIYPVKSNGSLDISINYDTIKNNLPYTTDEDWIGFSISLADTITITIG